MLACLLFFTCIYKYSNRKLLWNYPNFIEWITFIIFNALKHLENVLQSDNSMTIDCNKKRAIFISKNHSFKNFIFTIQMLFWNSIKIVVVFMNLYIWECCWLLEFFLMCLEIRIKIWLMKVQCLHVQTMLASRCVSRKTIEASSKLCIRFLYNLGKKLN